MTTAQSSELQDDAPSRNHVVLTTCDRGGIVARAAREEIAHLGAQRDKTPEAHIGAAPEIQSAAYAIRAKELSERKSKLMLLPKHWAAQRQNQGKASAKSHFENTPEQG